MSRSYKKRSCKIFTAPFITKPLTSNWKQAASFLSLYYEIALKSSSFSDTRLRGTSHTWSARSLRCSVSA